MRPFPSIALVAALLWSNAAPADPIRFAQANPAEAAAPAKPKKAAKPKPAPSESGSAARKRDADYQRTLQQPRRITKDDLEDDPSAPTAPRFSPSLTPEGRPAMGARF